MKELDLWIFIYNKINQNLRTNLLIVTDAGLSSKGKSGFKMAVSEDVETYGSIGGGFMEFEILRQLQGTLTQDKSISFIKKIRYNKTKDESTSGLIDSDTKNLIVVTLTIDHRDIIKLIIDNLGQQENGIMQINPTGFNYVPNKGNRLDINLFYESDEIWQYEENIGLLNTIYIIGGGHVGLALSRTMSNLDFYVVTFDQQKDIITMKQNDFAHQKIITSYESVNRSIKETNKSYAVIVTQNNESDKAALRSIVNMNLRFIGMMRSQKKSQSIFNDLENEGISRDLLNKVKTPVGLDIEAESAEEIAISIAAQIIKIKNS